MPSTLARFGFTGYTVPPNGELMRFHNVVRPTVCGVSVAPITATDCGLKKTSSGYRSRPNKECAGSTGDLIEGLPIASMVALRGSGTHGRARRGRGTTGLRAESRHDAASGAALIH